MKHVRQSKTVYVLVMAITSQWLCNGVTMGNTIQCLMPTLQFCCHYLYIISPGRELSVGLAGTMLLPWKPNVNLLLWQNQKIVATKSNVLADRMEISCTENFGALTPFIIMRILSSCLSTIRPESLWWYMSINKSTFSGHYRLSCFYLKPTTF